jgi:hypothetical protein
MSRSKANINLAGFAQSMRGHSYGVAYNIYQMTFFVGWPLALTFYIAINKFFPPPGLGVSEELEGYDDSEVIEGVSESHDDFEAAGEKKRSIALTAAAPGAVE